MKSTFTSSNRHSSGSNSQRASPILEIDSDLNARISLPKGLKATDLTVGLPAPPKFGFLNPPKARTVDHIETLAQWGDIPSILLIPEASAFIAQRCKQNPSAIQKVIAGAVLKGEIPCWGCSDEGGWKKGMIRVLYRSDLRRAGRHIKISTCISEGGRLHVEAMGVDPRDVIGLLVRRGRKVPSELLDLIEQPAEAPMPPSTQANSAFKNPLSGATDVSNLNLTVEAGTQWLLEPHWTERQLEALCFGIDPTQYGDRDEIAEPHHRDHAKKEIDEGLRSGRLRGKRKESSGPADAMYRCQWEIEPHSAVLWAEERFPRFPRFLVKEEMHRLYREQNEAKRAAGRFTLEEAALHISGNTENVQEVCAKLMRAALSGDLPVYLPGKLTKHDYGNDNTVREFYEEAYWEDLNKWLIANEPRLPFRFSTPISLSSPSSSPITDESADQRCARLAHRRGQLKLERTKAWQQQLAKEEGVSVARIKQLLKQYDDQHEKKPTANNPFGIGIKR
jgi:hypothetical protein